MVAYVGAIEVEISVWLLSPLACGRYDWGNLPVHSRAGPHFAISQDTVIEPLDSMCVSEIVRYTVTGLLHIRPYVKRYILTPRMREAGSAHPPSERRLRRDFPPEPGRRKNRVFTFDIDTDTEDE